MVLFSEALSSCLCVFFVVNLVCEKRVYYKLVVKMKIVVQG